MITSLQQVLESTKDHPIRTVAVAVAEQESVLESVRDALAADIARPLLFGSKSRIEAMAEKVGLDLAQCEVSDQPDCLAAAAKAVLAVREGRADLLMKGHIHSDDFLRAILHKDCGLRAGCVMSHVFVLETASRGKLTFVTDGAMNIAPDLATKAAIAMNAVFLANCFGIATPKVGILTAVELVNPAMPSTLEAAALAKMCSRGQFPKCQIEGPLALDNAVDRHAAEVKGIRGEVAGDCDILVCPDIESGNILSKSFAFLCGGRSAGVLVGASAPVVLTSRADSAEAKLFSIATAVLMVNLCRGGDLKIGAAHY
jgi:phosphate butyryltransferase